MAHASERQVMGSRGQQRLTVLRRRSATRQLPSCRPNRAAGAPERGFSTHASADPDHRAENGRARYTARNCHLGLQEEKPELPNDAAGLATAPSPLGDRIVSVFATGANR